MAMHMQLNGLMMGPSVIVEHDEGGDGSFKLLQYDVPLQMLTYFSETIREKQQTQSRHNPPYQFPGYLRYPSQAPNCIKIVGGDPSAHLDLIHWMRSCCQSNAIQPLSSILAGATRHIFAVTALRLLRIRLLDNELPALIGRLQNELLDVETVGTLFSSGDHVLPEVRDAICHCVAKAFAQHMLPDVDRWLNLGKVNKGLDAGVGEVLRQAQNDGRYDWGDLTGAHQLWLSKNDRMHQQGYFSAPQMHHQGYWGQQNYYQSTPQPGGHQPYAPTFPGSYHPHPQPMAYAYQPQIPAAPPATGSYFGPLPHVPYPPPPRQQTPRGYPNTPYRPPRPRSRSHTRSRSRTHHRTPSISSSSSSSTASIPRQFAPRAPTPHAARQYLNYPPPNQPNLPNWYPRPQQGHGPSLRPQYSNPHLNHRMPPYHRAPFRAPGPTNIPDPSFEAPQPGEVLRERRQIGDNHFLFFFVGPDGRERIVNKVDGLRMEGW